jgi:multidrug efflux pump subunit AcrA (membrane-fusion protein)
VDINASVRQNLGITFAKVEKRNVARTLRIPGRFELLPTARREYRVPVAGKIELLVQQFQTLEEGTPLFRLDSPRWRELQNELNGAQSQLRSAEAGYESIAPLMAALNFRLAANQSSVNLWETRVAKLEGLVSSGGARGSEIAQANGELAAAKTAVAEGLEKQAELTAKQAEFKAQLDAAQARISILLSAAACLSGQCVEDLAEIDNAVPRWQSISQIDVFALSPGVVDSIAAISGSYVDENMPVLTTVQPEQVCFRANALQSDMGNLISGMAVTVVAPPGGSLADSIPIDGTLIVAPTADPQRRTIGLIMMPNPQPNRGSATWARAGVSAFLEIVNQVGAQNELAVPLSSVVKDGTSAIIFRRDPKDPNKAIRLDADLGLDDGRWIVIKSGVAEGDEVVLDGVYQLMVATSGSITTGGHFHPDGTFHEADE